MVIIHFTTCGLEEGSEQTTLKAVLCLFRPDWECRRLESGDLILMDGAHLRMKRSHQDGCPLYVKNWHIYDLRVSA